MSMIEKLKKQFEELSEKANQIREEISQAQEKLNPIAARLEEISIILECLNEQRQEFQESYNTLCLDINSSGGDKHEAAFKTFQDETGLSNTVAEEFQEDSEESPAFEAAS